MPGPSPIRVLIVDDSPTVRAVLRRILDACRDIAVVAEAANGHQALAAVARAKPDVVLMDVEMPEMNGVEATHAIMGTQPTPILVITSRSSRREVRAAFQCFSGGALELLAKPEHPEAWEAMGHVLPDKIRVLAGAVVRPGEAAGARAPATLPRGGGPLRCIAVGASTGGPGALRSFLTAFSRPLPAPVLIVQHLAAGFESGLVEWLGQVTGLDVALAAHREALRPGTVRVAPGDHHMRVAGGGWLELDGRTPPVHGHRPSADELFVSCAEAMPTHTAGILLTGMGRDGATGLARLRQRGGFTLVQDEATCAVFGMPRAALELGAAVQALPPAGLAAAVERFARGEER